MNISLSSALLFIMSFFFQCHSSSAQTIFLEKLQERVEVLRDANGINHIYAHNEHDLFFAQGYLAAKDRLFQFEIWRRQATGTLAEILGPREIPRDVGARLFKFRGDKQTELNHYHPRGEIIGDAFVDGVNAYIEEARANPEQLPAPFKLLGILPEAWSWEIVVSRHQGLLENVKEELKISRVVSLLGPEKTAELYYFHPFEPILELDSSIPSELLFKDIIAPYEAFRRAVIFRPEDVVQEARNDRQAFQELDEAFQKELAAVEEQEKYSIGSNNWVVSGELTESGFPIMANDPHRLQAVPSLRYWVRLHAPGWDVIGGGEPVIPGVSIGHNNFGAWGLTIFGTDNEDIRIYDIHPQNPHRYLYKGEWRDMEMIRDTIPVKGEEPRQVEHYYTVHGPVTFIDEELNKAVAIEGAWRDAGGAPYLASLRMNQSRSWEEFRDACSYNHIPAENMVWADKEGNIGWQATGIAPIRKGFSGLVASLGDGSKDWAGYLPIQERPHAYNPPSGFIATANENLVDTSYEYPEALGYEWADAFRGDRIREVLGSGGKFTMEDMAALQNDYHSLPARQLTPYLKNLNFENARANKAKNLLLDWGYELDKNSVAAGIYVMWERKIRANINKLAVPEQARPYVGNVQMTKVLDWVEDPSLIADEPRMVELLENSFKQALSALEEQLGPNIEDWQYGQEDFKHAYIRHPLSAAVSKEWRQKLDVGPVARGGYSFTPAANAYGDNNSSGASFRIIVDTADWEKTIGINNPGQTENPESLFYKNLFPIWAEDGYFEVDFEREKLEGNALEKTVLEPAEMK
jgi:penicillin G amidase